MAKGASAGSPVARPGAAAAAVPRGSAAASSLRRRRTSGGGGGFGGGGNMLRFYTDDVPGLKITPTVVLVMSFCFIGFVTVLHAVGKLYQYKSG
ncbi:hypothetical protein O6H91_Y078300 [Diphasiastrum complanatum]|nr:hypothetical protein O6H91_Y078300 [Diphasiastrum complanatum]